MRTKTLFNPTHLLFRCSLTGFDEVNLNRIPSEMLSPDASILVVARGCDGMSCSVTSRRLIVTHEEEGRMRVGEENFTVPMTEMEPLPGCREIFR